MKSNLISLIGGAAVGFAVGCLISLKLCDRRHHTGGSFRELYEDNKPDKGGEKNGR